MSKRPRGGPTREVKKKEPTAFEKENPVGQAFSEFCKILDERV